MRIERITDGDERVFATARTYRRIDPAVGHVATL
jgi:hypothetical protein